MIHAFHLDDLRILIIFNQMICEFGICSEKTCLNIIKFQSMMSGEVCLNIKISRLESSQLFHFMIINPSDQGRVSGCLIAPSLTLPGLVLSNHHLALRTFLTSRCWQGHCRQVGNCAQQSFISLAILLRWALPTPFSCLSDVHSVSHRVLRVRPHRQRVALHLVWFAPLWSATAHNHDAFTNPGFVFWLA